MTNVSVGTTSPEMASSNSNQAAFHISISQCSVEVQVIDTRTIEERHADDLAKLSKDIELRDPNLFNALSHSFFMVRCTCTSLYEVSVPDVSQRINCCRVTMWLTRRSLWAHSWQLYRLLFIASTYLENIQVEKTVIYSITVSEAYSSLKKTVIYSISISEAYSS